MRQKTFVKHGENLDCWWRNGHDHDSIQFHRPIPDNLIAVISVI